MPLHGDIANEWVIKFAPPRDPKHAIEDAIEWRW